MTDVHSTIPAFEAYRKGNYEEALPLLSPLADQNDVDALLAVAWINETGAAGTYDLEFAQRCYLRAADAGSCDALYRLGRILRKSNDLNGALAAFERGAKQVHMPCISALGILMTRLSETPEQTKIGISWLNDAADRGHFYAKRELIFLAIKGNNSLIETLRLFTNYFVISIRIFIERKRDAFSIKIL